MEHYVIGTEAELTTLKINGGAGDYIIYSKEDDRNFPMRIAFLKSGGKQSTVQKLKILRNHKGQFSFQGKDKKWFNTMSKMIDESNNENSRRLKRPFLGFSSPPTSPTDQEEDIDGGYVLEEDGSDVLQQTGTNGTNSTRTPSPAPRKNKPTKPIDLIGDNAPDDVKILYNIKNVKSSLKNHQPGDFIVHQGSKNTPENPYTVYANKEKEGEIRLAPAYIYYDKESGNFSVGKKGKAYSMLGDLLKANAKTLVNHVDISD